MVHFQIDWHDGDNNVIVKDVTLTTKKLGDGKRFNSTSIVRFIPRKRHHNKNFTCSASNIADRSRRRVSIKLHVRYAPSVRLSTNSNHGPIREGEVLVFRCIAHANPKPTQYLWYVDGNISSGHYSSHFKIKNISREMHNKIVKCEVKNEIGKSEETETIQVRCKLLNLNLNLLIFSKIICSLILFINLCRPSPYCESPQDSCW